ncbi:NAD(P)/FAD-dependent oxidoreductase [Saccharopolyspora sp. ASAGF58]|uniref:flavin-containing monooxygenase n=1 Tax=Saccharopolyspora sp. ASAGF58 TaxID=2719023 RepID=UPI0014400551|nr:NAD(P)/FAD-dependent oxidoreductase [Saccharopolyspora sp. ASAGF58]QIZ37326.1 NAD(P)/FAD-dependent oxidoreductase [Saccharopolyspora sp. ASAGF58]
MPQQLRIGIIGAGFAGLSSAKVLRACGFDVVVLDACPDVGGVWSRTRRYPGLTTQNGKDSYALSDHPMPRDYPEWPSGEQVQQYLESYVDRFGLKEILLLGTRVVHAGLDEAGPSWILQLCDETTGNELPDLTVDHLVVANGIFSTPFVPDFPGAGEFTAAGGRVCSVSDVNDLDQVSDKDVLVVGYGKSACDAAAVISNVAASTAVIARELLWKIPRKFGNVLNYKYLLLTRLGEGLFRYITPTGFEKFLHGPGRPVRNAMLSGIQALITRQLMLRRTKLVPDGALERIARSTVSLATESFYERVVEGRIKVHRDTQITRLFVSPNGRPAAELADGTVLPADVVVCGTGWRQDIPFLSPEVLGRVTDEAGNFALYRQVLPHDVPALTFCGYNSSFYSPLSAEIAAWWIAAHLSGRLALPPEAERRVQVAERLAWMEKRTDGRHARGTNIVPFSVHNIDELLSDLGEGVGRPQRFAEWFRPLSLPAYAAVGERVIAGCQVSGLHSR